MEEDQIELTLETAPEDEIEIVEAPEEPKIETKPEITVDDGIEALRRELEAEKAARQRAEQRPRGGQRLRPGLGLRRHPAQHERAAGAPEGGGLQRDKEAQDQDRDLDLGFGPDAAAADERIHPGEPERRGLRRIV